MKRSILAIVVALSMFMWCSVFAADIDSMTLEELKEAYTELQSEKEQLESENTELMSRGINVYDTLKADDPVVAEAFMRNIKTIENLVHVELESAYQKTPEDTAKSDAKKRIDRKIFILDTCAIIHKPDIMSYFADDEYIRIPTKVVDELGKIKDKRSDKYDAELSSTARIFVRDINTKYLRLFNQKSKVRFLVENSALDLLPVDLDPKVPDNQILSVALKYKDWEVYIVSDDGVFRLISFAQNIKAITSNEFVESHKEQYKELKEETKNEFGKTPNDSVEKRNVNELEELTPLRGPEATKNQTLAIDDLPIKELKKYSPGCDDRLIEYLMTNQIKTIGNFKNLSESRVRGFSTKGKHKIINNTLLGIVKQKSEIIQKIQSDMN